MSNIVNYFSFNDMVINDTYLITNIERKLLPKRVCQVLDIPSRDGEIYDGSKYSSIEYSVNILIQGENEIDLKQKIKDLRDTFKTNKLVKISFDESKYAMGMVTEEIPLQVKSKLDILATIKVKCFVPYFYSYEYKLVDNSADVKYLNFENNGQLPVKPFISIGFTKEANFVQLKNSNTGKTLLIGEYPKLELTNINPNKCILQDECNSTSNWSISTVSIDSNRISGGTLGMTENGEGICIGTLPSGEGTWKGVQVRQNLDHAIDEFEVTVELDFSSKGVNGDPYKIPANKETITSGGVEYYYQVTSTTLAVREGPSTKHTRIGTLKKGFKIYDALEVNGWIRYKYNEIGGDNYIYSSKKYLTKKSVSSTVTTTKQNAVAIKSTPIRATYGLKGTKVGNIPKNGVIRVITSTKYLSYDDDYLVREWYKLAIPYNGVSGYVCVGNLTLASNSDKVITIDYEEEIETADDKTGILEIYGMGVNNERIFKFEIHDDNKWYEYNQPKMFIGNNEVYKDTTNVPPPNTIQTNDDGNIKITNYLSGAKGDWNDFSGDFYIKRVKEGDNYKWTAQIRKKSAGVITKTKNLTNLISNKYPIDKLAYIIVYMGTNGDMSKCTSMAINKLYVTEITPVEETENNIILFNDGDILDIDFENRNIYLNEIPRNDLVDIGSDFFDIDIGLTSVNIFSNDDNIVVGAVLQEKWMGGE